MKFQLLFLIIFFHFTSHSQDTKFIHDADTVFFYFEADNKFMVKNDKLLLTKKMRDDLLVIYLYNLRGDGLYYGTPSFINKNFNSETLPIERPAKLSWRKFRKIKNIITIDDIKKQGFEKIFSEAIYGKKVLFLIEKRKNGKLTIHEVEYYGVVPSNE